MSNTSIPNRNGHADALDAPAREFFYALYGEVFDGVLSLWWLPEKRSRYFTSAGVATAQELCRVLACNHDMYFSVGLIRHAKAEYERVKNEDVIAIPGLWVDLDVEPQKIPTID